MRRTRQWETTFEDEVLGVADRIDAMLQIRSDERAPFLCMAGPTRARAAQTPTTICTQQFPSVP
mgnify:FL=1